MKDVFERLASLESKVAVLRSALISVLLASGPIELSKAQIEAGLNHRLIIDKSGTNVTLSTATSEE